MPLMEEIARAAAAVIAYHGTKAACVAEKRASNAELSGSASAAHIWREVLKAILKMQGGDHLSGTRRSRADPMSR